MRGLASFLLAVGASCAVCFAASDQPQRRPFPEIDLLDAKGGVQSLKSALGQVTILNFWATWCGPCRLELPELQQVYNEMAAKGVVILAVNVDSPREQVAPFFKRANLSLPVFFLDDETEATIGVRSLPTTVLLDADGMVVNVWGGYSREGILELRQQVDNLLAQARGRGGKSHA
jgi:thiol-disulfide isomerase/thioredoxin